MQRSTAAAGPTAVPGSTSRGSGPGDSLYCTAGRSETPAAAAFPAPSAPAFLKNPGPGALGAMRENVTRLPDAGREEQLERWGLSESAHWTELDHVRLHADEVPGDRRGRSYADENLEEFGFLVDGGWHAASIKGGEEEGGVTSHRGVLHPDEYVDDDLFIAQLEQALGFTYEEIRSVYRQGRKSDTQRELRGRIDARLLALSRSRGNLAELGRRLGFKVEDDGHCEPFDNALRRARAAEGVAS